MKAACDCVCHKLGYTYCDCPTHAAFGNSTTLPPHLAAKARNPLQVELATILTNAEKEPDK